MPNIALSDARVKVLRPRRSAYDIRDAKLRGFGVRVLPSGARRFFIHTQHRGKRIWRIVGDANAINIDEARTQAASLLAAIRCVGDTPTSPDATRFETVAETVFHRYARVWKPQTLYVNRNYLRRQILPWFAGTQIADITRTDVQRWFASRRATPVAADRSMPILSVILQEAERMGYRLVERMAVLDDDFVVDATLAEGGDGIWLPPRSAPAVAQRDFQSRYEQQRARAEAAEARCEELRWAEVAARSDAGSWKSRFGSCRRRLSEAVEEAKDLRRAAKAGPSLRAAVARLETLLSEAGVASDETGALGALGKEVVRLREVLAEPEAVTDTAGWRSGEASRDRASPEEVPRLKAPIRSLRTETNRLNKEVARGNKAVGELHKKLDQEKERAESIRETAKSLSRESLGLYRELRILRDCEARVRSLSDEAYRLRHALDVSEAGKDKLKARLAKLRAVGATLSKLPFDEAAHLRTVLRRSRRQKTTIKSLSRENARLRKAVKGSRNRVETLEAQLVKLRSTGAVLSRRLYGRKSERQAKPRSERKRGQQRGAPGHGRIQRPGLEERPEDLASPEDACVCAQCGQSYVPNGAEESTLVEIEVKAHKRVIRRPRLRRGCECASSPMEVSAPPVPRLFRGTPYGISFWARFLFELCVCLRPVHRLAAWMSAQALAVSPGTLANRLKRFVPLFEAILTHQNEAVLRHADETGWRVQELRGEHRSNRAWRWTSVSDDAVCFHIDASRSAEAAEKLFAGIVLYAVIVCDRYSAYKKLARMLGGLVTLAFCWVHVRRDFIDCAAGQDRLEQWCQRWIERIAELYRLNEARLKHYDTGLKRQTPAFDTAQTALNTALEALFAQAERELAALPGNAREGKALRSLLNHRDGLCVFVDRPEVPLDNNKAERFLRGPSRRRLSFGSDSEKGAEFTAIMYSVVGTLSMNGIDVLRWLEAWLTACAENGRPPPGDLSPWLPWSMSEERKREFAAQG